MRLEKWQPFYIYNIYVKYWLIFIIFSAINSKGTSNIILIYSAHHTCFMHTLHYLKCPNCTVFTTCSELRKVLFLALSVTFCLFVNQISHEPLNGFVPNSQGRCVWSLARTSLNVKVKGQRSRSPWTKSAVQSRHPPAATEWSVLLHDAL